MASKFGGKAKALAAGLVAIGVILSIIGIGVMNSNSIVNASKELNISNVKLTSLTIDRKDKGLRLDTSVTISNPSSESLKLMNAQYAMSVNQEVSLNASGPEAVEIPAHSSKTITVTAILKPDNNTSAKVLKNLYLLKKATIGVGILAKVPVKWFNVAQYSTTTVEIGGHTTQDIGPLLAMAQGLKSITLNRFEVVDTKWYVNGHEVTYVNQGDYVTAKVRIKAIDDLVQAPISICVLADVKVGDDSIYSCKNYIYVSLKSGEEKDISMTFKVTNVYDNYRGFYLEVGLTGCNYFGCGLSDVFYTMPNHYPPRLRVSHVNPYVLVVGAGWFVGGREVTEVHRGAWVDARVTLKALTRSHGVKVEFCVRRDYKHWFDKDEKCMKTTINLDKGQTTTLTIHFQANHHTWLRGYFMKVKIWEWDEHTWQMPSHYPPRLKVN